MTTLDTAQAHFVSRFGDCESRLADAGPEWLAPIRRAAIERFAELGFPTRRNEAWKYTSVADIAVASLDPEPPARAGVSREDIRALLGSEASHEWFVFEDGRFAPELSSGETLPTGVEIGGLAGALGKHPELIRPLLDRADLLDRPFAALNDAFQRDGAFIRVAGGASPQRPIQLLFVASPAASGRVANPRNIIQIERGAMAAVMLRFESLCKDVYWTNAMTQILLEENAELDLLTVQSESDTAYHFSSVDVRQKRDSRFRSHHIALGGALARSEIYARLDAPGVDCTLNGLFLGDGHQHHDSQTTVDHASPHGTSRELYKGILGDHSRGVFNGSVLVRPDAQKTNAQQFNPNLLISDDAQINTKPTLEISADDVKCSHGSTVGRLDEDALFYLRARGVDERAARQMLTVAFASEIANAVPQDSLRAQVEQLIAAKLERSRSAMKTAGRSPEDPL
ncbi:MAG: Fe-S cluster assembly protein SufD [Deltaproteobacteria bacterium]|nr:Fe-S cluster assembly protein SufD [Deltaproteobacteria bacterium]